MKFDLEDWQSRKNEVLALKNMDKSENFDKVVNFVAETLNDITAAIILNRQIPQEVF